MSALPPTPGHPGASRLGHAEHISPSTAPVASMARAAPPLRALFVMPNLTPGGAERVMITLLSRLDARRIHATLVLIDGRGAAWLDELPPGTEVVDLGIARARLAVSALLRLVRVRRPQIVFSMVWHLNALLALIKPLLPAGTRLIGRETSLPSLSVGSGRLGALRRRIVRHAYPRLDALVCQGEAMRADVEQFSGFAHDRIAIVPNPIDVERVRRLARDPSVRTGFDAARIEFVAIGRLERVKGHDRLIEALAHLARPQVRLTIIGSGSLARVLRQHAQARGVAEQVRFVGHATNPYPYLAGAHALLIASRFEGFPNVALEAIACGTPVLATPSPGGLREIVAATPGCRLAVGDNPASLALLMGAWIDGEREPVPDDALARHRVETVVDTFATLLEDIAAGAAPARHDARASGTPQ